MRLRHAHPSSIFTLPIWNSSGFADLRKTLAQYMRIQFAPLFTQTNNEKDSARCRARDLNLGPLGYGASAQSIELSFWIKIKSELMTNCDVMLDEQCQLIFRQPYIIWKIEGLYVTTSCKLLFSVGSL